MIKALFAESSVLREAGLDWEKYHVQISSEMRHHRVAVLERTLYGYSKHAFMFLLTLLPNLKRLELPRFWCPTTSIANFMETIFERARQIHPHRQPILSKLSDIILEGLYEYISTRQYRLPEDKMTDLMFATPFLALPKIRNFRYSDCVAYHDGLSISRYLSHGFESSLESLHSINANSYDASYDNLVGCIP